jgi:hypothetical protein
MSKTADCTEKGGWQKDEEGNHERHEKHKIGGTVSNRKELGENKEAEPKGTLINADETLINKGAG